MHTQKPLSFGAVLRKTAPKVPVHASSSPMTLAEMVERYSENPYQDFTLRMATMRQSKRSMRNQYSQHLQPQVEEMFDSWIQRQALCSNKENLVNQRRVVDSK